MTTGQFIALNNPQGVAEWARELGFNVQPVPDAAFEFLEFQYRKDPVNTALKLKELHPHLLDIDAALNQNGSAKKAPCSCSGCKSKKKFKNFDGEDADEPEGKDYLKAVSDLINQGLDKSSNALKNITGGDKDHAKEMLIYGAVFFAGFIACKLLNNK